MDMFVWFTKEKTSKSKIDVVSVHLLTWRRKKDMQDVFVF